MTKRVVEETQAILVVDDHAPIRKVIRRHLELAGYSVAEASSGKEALMMIGKEPIQLVLLDVMMPNLDGIEVCKLVRNGKTSLLPVVMVSAHGTSLMVKRARQSGANDFLVKPFSKKLLLEKVAKWVGVPAAS